MRKLILKMSLSADGFVGGPNGEVEWLFGSIDEGAVEWTVSTLWRAGVHIMGARTFRDMRAYWPTSDEPYAAPMNDIPKAVFSRSGEVSEGGTTRALDDANAQSPIDTGKAGAAETESWTNAYVATGPLADEIAKLKRQPGEDILAHGGASFARSLVEQGLVDEYRLLIHPIVLGQGLPLFSTLPEPLSLRLMSATAFPSGAIAKVYRPEN
jgi:dihydrofolate reductase